MINQHTITLRRTALAVFLMAVLFSSATHFQYAHATPIFDDEQNISNNGVAILPQVIVNGSTNVHTAWLDLSAGQDVMYLNNTRGFAGPPQMLTDGTGTNGATPQIAITGSTVYVAWIDGAGTGNIMIAKSIDGGHSFDAQVTPPFSGTTIAASATSFKIFADNNNLYVVWLDTSNNIQFATSENGYSTITALDSSTSNIDPTIAASGAHVYVAWENTAGPHSVILFSNSTDNGLAFNAGGSISTTLSDTSKSSAKPAIAAAGSDVYVTWQEQETTTDDTDISFKASTNNGHTFGSMKNLSSNTGRSQLPQIAASGSNVYVTWLDNQAISSTLPNDVLITSSTNSGTSFCTVCPINLSSNTGDSSNLHISANGTNVNVIWSDSTITPNDLFYKGSTNSGASFGGFVRMNNVAGTAMHPQISSSLTDVSVVWDNGVDVFYKTASPSTISINYDKSQYSQRDTATITVTAPSFAGTTIHPIVNSTHDGTGFSPTFTETGPGIFTTSIHFNDFGSMPTSNPANATLSITGTGDVITTSFGGQSAIASTIVVTVTLDSTSYDRGVIAHVTVDDANANLNPIDIDTITVKVTSNANPTGTEMQLNETGPNTGIFGSTTLDSLIFMEGNNLLPASGTITMTQSVAASAGAGTITESVKSTSDGIGITIPLTETGSSTGLFSGKVKFGSSTVAGSTIKVKPGDIVTTVNFGGTLTENSMITPKNATNGAILVTKGTVDDLVKVTYRGVTAQATIDNSLAGGGASGGISRASFVVDALASIGGSNPVPPTFDLTAFAANPGALPDNIRKEVLAHDPLTPITPHTDNSFDYPLIIDGGGYVLGGLTNTIVTRTETTGTPVDIKLNLPATGLEHLALYTNLRGSSNEIPNSDTYIIYDKGQPLQVVDPHGYFAKGGIKFNLDTQNNNNKIDYSITFAKAMEKSDIIFRAWNDRMSSSDVKILSAWEVLTPQQTSSSQLSPSQVIQTPQTPPTPTQMPQTTEPDLMPAIKDWGGFSSNPISDSEFLSHMGITGQSIPKWVATPAKYVVSGDLTPQEFEIILKYLASQGIIK